MKYLYKRLRGWVEFKIAGGMLSDPPKGRFRGWVWHRRNKRFCREMAAAMVPIMAKALAQKSVGRSLLMGVFPPYEPTEEEKREFILHGPADHIKMTLKPVVLADPAGRESLIEELQDRGIIMPTFSPEAVQQAEKLRQERVKSGELDPDPDDKPSDMTT